MKNLKFAIVKILDWIDDKILNHRSITFCRFISIKLEKWWLD